VRRQDGRDLRHASLNATTTPALKFPVKGRVSASQARFEAPTPRIWSDIWVPWGRCNAAIAKAQDRPKVRRMAGRYVSSAAATKPNEMKAPRKNSHSPLRIGRTPVLTRREGLPRIEYVFDIGSDIGRSPAAHIGTLPHRESPIAVA
jgi:hypothetical protein